MKDLLLYVADADAQAFLRSVLSKPQSLAIRSISFDIERHPQRDSGMVQSGAELTRMKKGSYHKALIAWDHHGSGRDRKQSADNVRDEIQRKLDSFTWCDNSSITIIVPELEQWLWFCESAVLSHCGLSLDQLQLWLREYAGKTGQSIDNLKRERPKELFEFVMRDRLRRTISPRDFEEIGRLAGINGLMECATFRSIVETLRVWFPQ